MAYIELKNITKSYDGVKDIVKDISFSIDKDEFLVLLGPSGCGKTTILRMIAGLEPITNGTISINGKIANNLEPKDRNIGMVFQNYALYPHLSVSDNIGFPLRINKISKQKIKEKVIKVAEILELSEYLSKKPKELSGGQRQRVALGRAIIKEPDIFLFDEPLSNLDAKLRVQMRNEIVKLQKKIGKPAVYVTHDQIEAMTMGDKIVILNEGSIQQIGTPQEIYNKPSNLFVAGFIGSPQINIFNIINLNDNLCEVESNISFKTDKKIEKIYRFLCIRPEKLYLENLGNKLFSFEARFIRYEFIGNEYFVYFSDTNNNIKTLRTNKNSINYINNETINIFYNIEDLLFY
jgi:ABC-type sugar transport system ATPase subunit